MAGRPRTWACLVASLWTFSACVRPPANSVALESCWEYAWTQDPSFAPDPAAVWKPDPIRRVKPDRGNHQLVRLRCRLPHLPFAQPTLFLFGIDQIFEVHTDRGRVYSFGDLRPGHRSHPGFMKRHFVPLGPDDAHRYIYFHVFADWSNIGFSAVPLVGDLPDLHDYNWALDLDLFFFSAFFFLAGVASLFFFLRRRTEWLALWFSIAAFEYALFTFYHTHIKYSYWDSPQGWGYLAAFLAFTLPLPLNAYYRELFGARYRRFFDWSILAFALCFLGAFGVLAVFGISRTYQDYGSRPFAIACAIHYVALFWLAVREFRKGSSHAGPVALGLVVLFLNGIPHLAYEARLISETQFRFHWGLAFFFLCLAWLVAQRFSHTYDENERYAAELETKNAALSALIEEKSRFNAELEGRVRDRTRDLELMHEAAARDAARMADLERRLALRSQKDAILSDVHDRLGAIVTDFAIAADRMSLTCDPTICVRRDEAEPLLANIVRLAGEMRVSFRSFVDEVADFHMMTEDFLAGLHMRLLRRYSNAGRRIVFHGEGPPEVGNPLGSRLSDVCHIVEEVCTNDLKYGEGTASWSARICESALSLALSTCASTLVLDSAGPLRNGRGRRSIGTRAEKLKAEFTDSVHDGRYNMTLVVPLRES